MAFNYTIWPSFMISVALVVYEGISLFHLSVPIAIFQDANPDGVARFTVTVCAEKPGKITTANGLTLDVVQGLNQLSKADVIIFPSWEHTLTPSKQLTRLVVAAAAQGKTIVGLCVGAYALAYCGLLENKFATTHWRYSDDFGKRFGRVKLDSNRLFIAQENIVTSAGTAAALDCCLHLVATFYGTKVANQIARMMVSAPARTGGQNQFIEHAVIGRPSDNRLAELVTVIQADLQQSYTLKWAADFCAMSIRSFSRHFLANYSKSFVSWLNDTRLHYACELLEETHLSIARVAEEVGFSSQQMLRKHFSRRYDVNPAQWRISFQQSHQNK